MEITENTQLADIIRADKRSLKVLQKYNMGCASCAGVRSETLRNAAQMHGADLNGLIKDLQSVFK